MMVVPSTSIVLILRMLTTTRIRRDDLLHDKGRRRLTPVFGLEDVGSYGRSLAQFLTDHGQVVKEVNPALSYAERKSHVTVQKSDSWNAECVARILVRQANREIGRCTLYFTT